MARLYTNGFELQTVAALGESEAVTGAPTINTTIKRSGAASLRCNPTAATAYVMQTFQTDQVNTTYHRFYIYIATLPSAATTIWQWLDSGNGVAVGLRLNTTGTVDALLSTATVLGTSAALTTGAWHKVEILYTDSAASTAAFTPIIDGTNIGVYTGQPGVSGGGRSRLGVITAVTTDLYFDDWAINNTTGTVQNSYPGDGSVVVLVPNAAGDNNGWPNATGGTAGAANNYTRVNQIPFDDATTYNMINATAAANTLIDDFNVTDSATAGIGSSDVITLVQVRLRGGSTATTTGATVTPRIKGQAAGTTTVGGADAFNITTWRTDGASPAIPGLTAYTNPQTSAAWTPATLDTMQIGYSNGASNTTVRRISGVYAIVEFVPSGTTTTTTTSTSTTTTTTTGLAKMATVSDDFNDNSLNLAKWVKGINGTSTVLEVNQQIEITLPTAAVGTDYAALNTLAAYDLTSSAVYMQVKQIVNTATTANCTMVAFRDSNNWLRFVVESGTIFFQRKNAGTQATVLSMAYNATSMAYWQLREAAGIAYWETSPTGLPGSWTTQATYTHGMAAALSNVAMNLEAYCYTTETAPGKFIFDNFNIIGGAGVATNLFFF